MFYVSRVSLLFFMLAIVDLFLGLYIKATNANFISYAYMLIFGFVLNTIIGAYYQILPNSQQVKLPLEKFGYVVFLLSIISSSYLFFGNFTFAFMFLVATIYAFLIHILTVIRNLKPLTVKYLAFSIIYLSLLPILLMMKIKGVPLNVSLVIHTFTLGVMVNAIWGVQTAWIPMIYMQTLGQTKLKRIVINSQVYLYQLFVLLTLVGFYTANLKMIAGMAMLVLALEILFLKFVVYDSIKPQLKLQGLPYQIKFFLAGHLFFIIGLILAHVMAVANKFSLIGLHIDFMLLGFGFFTIVGGMVHLIPRIIWNMVYIRKAQQMKNVPNVKGVISRQKAERLFWVALAGYILFIVADILLGSLPSALIFGFAEGYVLFSFWYDFYRLYSL